MSRSSSISCDSPTSADLPLGQIAHLKTDDNTPNTGIIASVNDTEDKAPSDNESSSSESSSSSDFDIELMKKRYRFTHYPPHLIQLDSTGPAYIEIHRYTQDPISWNKGWPDYGLDPYQQEVVLGTQRNAEIAIDEVRSPRTNLVDRQSGYSIGSIKAVAKQYGVSVRRSADCLVVSGKGDKIVAFLSILRQTNTKWSLLS